MGAMVRERSAAGPAPVAELAEDGARTRQS
jgi:hypothetical protein